MTAFRSIASDPGRARRRAGRPVLLVLMVAWLTGSPALVQVGSAQSSGRQAPSEYQVKAAYLYNFARFVSWPTAADPGPPQAIRVCVLGDDPFGPALDPLTEQTAQGRPFVLIRPVPPEEIGDCHLLYISSSERDGLASIFETLAGHSVLTVGESDGFATAGGMIGFVESDARIRLEINLDAARAASLEISSKLLEVSRIVTTAPAGEHP